MKIEQTKPVTISDLWSGVESKVGQASHLEAAAQELATAIHAQFKESVVLARVFFTVDFDDLPASNQDFVRNLAGADLDGATPVLSLVGTHGEEADWNDRRKSKGHVGIPLISAAFVDAIPMISRLLKELGVPLDWVDTHESDLIQKSIGRSEGLFFVKDASQATDAQNRKIIAAQDFVSQYGVKSVFGIGGAYPGGQLLVIVSFCRDIFPREASENFLPLVSLFKGKTASLVDNGEIFKS
ncbi:MAG: hypothetical protein ACE5NW_15690 [Acidiferrobacterales bacterium]